MLLIFRSPFHKRTPLLHAFTSHSSQNPKHQHSLHFNQIETSEDEIRHPLVKEVCRLIQFTSNWTPTLEYELRQLIRTLKPSQLCTVLQNQSDARTALQLFYWTDRLWRYQHHPVVYNTMLEILSKTSLYQGAKRVIR
ncbi:putative tetratricopeptide-like helical domain superfamily [Helianthus annuus]|nr:putative tetratricopeptide-like helical domain superfamily [Helianthus annuus]